MAIGTARMAHLALPNSRLRVGLDFGIDPVVRAELARSPETYVLFPGPDALPVQQIPRDHAVTLIVLDGTWWQARKLLKLNPELASLPRVAFHPRARSAYLIRRQPADFCVSTIEALAEVLGVLEPEAGGFDRLLDPFHAMVERQRWFRDEVRSSRHRTFTRGAGVSPASALSARLDADWSRLVCVHGEANSWPRQHPARHEPEIVHWLAHRPATAETFEAVLAPRSELAPATSAHIGLPAELLLAGGTVEDWHAGWASFARPDDILVHWGTFYRDLACSDGLPLGLKSVNLRTEASRLLRRRVACVEKTLGAFDATPASLALPGRGGRRLCALVGVLESMRCSRPETVARSA